MKLALAQMRMTENPDENLASACRLIGQAADSGADLILFPEIQLSPFFPQYEKQDVSRWLMKPDGPEVRALQEACRKGHIWASPNLYLSMDGRAYDSSLLIDADGGICGISKMVHVAQAEHFYEQDYYTPSEDGFHVFETPFGRIGIVICFDRHLPESIRTCALRGAQLILIPTANTAQEDMELFEWEIRVQAMQNSVYLAMCNRVGTEGGMDFAGESILAAPDGGVVCKAGREEALLTAEIDLCVAADRQAASPYLALRRTDLYE